MSFVKSFFNKVSNIGVDRKKPLLRQKGISLSNIISLFLLPLTLFGLIVGYIEEIDAVFIVFSLFGLFLLSVFPLNRYGKSTSTKIGLSVLPSLLFLLTLVFIGIGLLENYLIFSYSIVSFSIIPLLLFQEKKDRKLLVATLIFCFITILMIDPLLVWIGKSELIVQSLMDNYFLYKIPPIILWVVLVSSFLFMKLERLQYIQGLEKTTNSLIEYKKEIQTLKNEISSQSEAINEKQSTIDEQNKSLESNSEKLKIATDGALESAKKAGNVNSDLNISLVKNIMNALDVHYLIARYDLSGNLISINSKLKEILGEDRNEYFQHIKPIIRQNNLHGATLDEHYFSHIWDKIINGKSHTVNLKFEIGDTTKCLATTFALLFDSNKKAYEILAIGQDISTFVQQVDNVDKINRAQREKLTEVSQQIDLLNFQQMDIFEKSELLIAQKEEIQSINESLELRVKERTEVLEKKNKQLTEYAFINSHVLRSPLSTMMGLINLIKYTTLSEEDQKIYEHLKNTSHTLDNIVMKINNAIENGLDFDRQDLEPERSFHAIKKD